MARTLFCFITNRQVSWIFWSTLWGCKFVIQEHNVLLLQNLPLSGVPCSVKYQLLALLNYRQIVFNYRHEITYNISIICSVSGNNGRV